MVEERSRNLWYQKTREIDKKWIKVTSKVGGIQYKVENEESQNIIIMVEERCRNLLYQKSREMGKNWLKVIAKIQRMENPRGDRNST